MMNKEYIYGAGQQRQVGRALSVVAFLQGFADLARRQGLDERAYADPKNWMVPARRHLGKRQQYEGTLVQARMGQ